MPIRLNYYEILEVPSGANHTQIRRAYLKLARKYHPDLNPENRLAEEKFKEIQEAYQVLSDPDRRRDFDDLSRPPPRTQRRPRPASHSSTRPATQPKQGFGEFIQSIFGIGTRTTSGSGSKGHKSSRGPQTQLVLSLEDAHRGGVHKITVLDRRRCPICRGRKKIDGRPCPQCRASGQLHTPVNIDVNIPPGARNGSLIRVTCRQETGLRPASREIHVKIIVEPHTVFKIDGDDIYFEVPITPWEAALGASIDIQGIDGRLDIRVPAGVHGGKQMRVRGAGLNRREGGRGDAYVRLNIVVPANPGEREKALYQELADVTGFNPRSTGNSTKGK